MYAMLGGSPAATVNVPTCKHISVPEVYNVTWQGVDSKYACMASGRLTVSVTDLLVVTTAQKG